MKKLFSCTVVLLLVCTVFTSCCRNRDEIWDDTKSAGRHVKRGFRSLGGKHSDSRQVKCRDDFYSERNYSQNYELENEFIPLADNRASNEIALAAFTARQPNQTPGDPGSSIPGIEAFHDPSKNPSFAGIFRTVHFPFDSSLLKGSKNLSIIAAISNYMKTHPNVYLFVEGHCDERGAEAYNLALGARRANTIRNTLVKEGVNPDNIFTISYGKEKPLVVGRDEETWAQNRRGEFKIYHR